MPLRGLLFSPDAEVVRMIAQVLTELEIEGESCFQAVEAVEKVTSRPFQLVIIDWSSQPEAGFLLNTSRERKPADRPLTLAIVSDDASVPTALQAGANSVLRKPLSANQVKDTLATARDLLRVKFEPPNPTISAASAILPMEVQTTLHAGEFLQPSGSVPSPQFETEPSDIQKSLDQAAAAEIDPLKDLEPTAAPAFTAPPAPPSQPAQTASTAAGAMPDDDEPRGLAWYLKTRARSSPADEKDPEPLPAPSQKAELLGFDQTPSHSQFTSEESTAPASDSPENHVTLSNASPQRPDPQQHEEAALFAYITGENDESEKKKKEPSAPRPWLKKVAIAAAIAAAAGVAYFVLPQAVVEKDAKQFLGKATRAGHNWLNPQPATPTQIQAHEDFGRAGDEYKLPVAENIPDANTDPSQIRVLPVVDPNAKPANNGTSATDPSVASASTAVPGTDPAQADPSQNGSNQTVANQIADGQAPLGGATSPTADGQAVASQTTVTAAVQSPTQLSALPANQAVPNPVQPGQAATVVQSTSAQPATVTTSPPQSSSAVASNLSSSTTPTPTPALQTSQMAAVAQPLRNASYPATTTTSNSSSTAIPSSLKSSMAQMSPDASGNKPPEAALPSIEPVNLPEGTARGLLMQGPAPAYPPSAGGASGSVVLQVLIGRDGTVQDAKFLQGSLAFARPAIEAVKLWRFKPYLMNGRPASTQTLLTLSFHPAS